MTNCDECEKNFGFLEKTYETTSGKRLCGNCVQDLKSRDKVDKKVELPESSYIPVQKESSTEYQNYVSLTDEPISESKKDKWEFRVIKLSVDVAQLRKGLVTIEKFEETINKMGDDGWELVSVIPLNIILMQREGIPQPAMIFKRKV